MQGDRKRPNDVGENEFELQLQLQLLGMGAARIAVVVE
jgi:hypothetical protein